MVSWIAAFGVLLVVVFVELVVSYYFEVVERVDLDLLLMTEKMFVLAAVVVAETVT